MFCKNCGSKLDDDALFCTNCGAKIADEMPINYCGQCGAKLDADAAFCSACGTKVQKENYSAKEPDAVPIEGQMQTAPQPVAEPAQKEEVVLQPETQSTVEPAQNAEQQSEAVTYSKTETAAVVDDLATIEEKTEAERVDAKLQNEEYVTYSISKNETDRNDTLLGFVVFGIILIVIVYIIFVRNSIYKNNGTVSSSIEKNTESETISSSSVEINTTKQQELKEIPMVRVEGGTYTMGDGFHSDIPQKTVSVSSFYIAVTELTQRQWKIIFGDDFNPSFFKGDDYPIDSVNWVQAIVFCNRLSEYYGRTPCYTINGNFDIEKGLETQELTSIHCDFSANGYRLPTEAEWEYAAREGNLNSKYRCSGSDNVNDVCWYFDNSKKTTHPVASKAPNALGIYDMSGNVSEWCWDGHIFKGDNSLLKRARGGDYGSYLNWSSSLYVDCRDGEGVEPYFTYKGRGFRLVRTAN